MGKKYLTEKEQEELKKNRYIEKVSEKAITYSPEFKERFEIEYDAGKMPSQILDEMGIDPKVLGRKRVDGIVTRMKKYKERAEGWRDNRKNNSGRPSTKKLSEAEKIKRLEQKIEYLKQENEFIKKNIQLYRMAKLKK